MFEPPEKLVRCERCGAQVLAYVCEDPDELEYLCEPHSCVIGIPPSHLSRGTVGPPPLAAGEAAG